MSGYERMSLARIKATFEEGYSFWMEYKTETKHGHRKVSQEVAELMRIAEAARRGVGTERSRTLATGLIGRKGLEHLAQGGLTVVFKDELRRVCESVS